MTRIPKVPTIIERAYFKTLPAVSGLILQTRGTNLKGGKVHVTGQQRDLPVRGASYEQSTTRT